MCDVFPGGVQHDYRVGNKVMFASAIGKSSHIKWEPGVVMGISSDYVFVRPAHDFSGNAKQYNPSALRRMT